MSLKTGLHLLCFAFILLAESVALAHPDDWLQISNSPQCAVDMSEPTASIFIAATLRDYSLISQELAPQIQKDALPFIKEGNRLFKIKLNLLTQKIIKGLDSKALPFIQDKNDALIQEKWKQLGSNQIYQNIKEVKCYQVNDINSYYSHLFIRGINVSTLEELARQFKDNKSRLNGCSEEQIEANSDLYPVFNYDLKINNSDLWKKEGFQFWTSFKIYLSWAWRNAQVSELNEGPYKKIFKAIPIEEQVIFLSNGCKSIAKPECQSDFLSSTELRTLFTLDRKKLDLTSSSLEMRDNIIDNNDDIDFKAQQQLAMKADENKWVRSFQKSYLGFTQAHKEKLYSANKVMSSLVSQKGLSTFIDDLRTSYQSNQNNEAFYYLCSEARLLGQDKPFSVFKFDLEFIQKQGAKLNDLLKYGLTVEEMIHIYEKVQPELFKLCDDFDQKLKTKPEIKEKWSDYRPWYKSYLSRYKIIKDYLDLDAEEQKQKVKDSDANQTYVKAICSDSIDCARKVIEGVVNIDKVLLHSKTFFRSDFVSAPLFNERAEKVACQLYDPWEASQLNHKKLLADIGSSLLFGWTNFPIYLDVNFKPKELVSLNKLIENGQVKFDLAFDKSQIQKSLSLNFGSFLNVPCSVSISQTSKAENSNSTYVFNGLSVNACSDKKFENLSSPDGRVDTFKKSPETDRSVCGQCSLSFSAVSQFATGSAFAPLRFIIRLAESLIRYNNAKNDDSINPRQFNINTKYLLQTYEKYNRIPEQCVPLLSRGLKCQANLCEALAVKEFELKTGLEVEEITLTKRSESESQSEYEYVYIKSKSCPREIRTSFRCSENGDSFFMPIYPRLTKDCQIEARQ